MRRLLLLALVLVLVTGACSSRSSTSTDSAAPPAVTIDTFMFSPKTLRVRVGEKVMWTNKDDILHTVTAPDGEFDLQLDGRGATASHAFETAGTRRYMCSRHPGMEAAVDVA
jgi:plastocyanin